MSTFSFLKSIQSEVKLEVVFMDLIRQEQDEKSSFGDHICSLISKLCIFVSISFYFIAKN